MHGTYTYDFLWTTIHVVDEFGEGIMLVKKGQNNKIINLHDKTVMYTSRFTYIHQDSYLYIRICISASRSISIHKDLHKYIKIHELKY